MYKLELHRNLIKYSSFSIGELCIYACDDHGYAVGSPVFKCFTLEPSVPVIPLGSHNVSLTYSSRFSRRVPYKHYRGVPLISSPSCPASRGIRIHIGNYPHDTSGCILVGSGHCNTGLLNSRHTYEKLMNYMEYCYKIDVYESY